MGNFYVDSKFPPEQIPSDAIVVLKWVYDYPPHWKFVAMGSGFSTMPEASQALKESVPDLNGESVLITQVGGIRSRVKQLTIDTQTSRTLIETDPVPRT
jgi:hypothetical protein